jgi:hypothetical protein
VKACTATWRKPELRRSRSLKAKQTTFLLIEIDSSTRCSSRSGRLFATDKTAKKRPKFNLQVKLSRFFTRRIEKLTSMLIFTAVFKLKQPLAQSMIAQAATESVAT